VLPAIIQGGMGVYISTPSLARSVSRLGGLGTVSGVAAGLIMPRVLQAGDPGGHCRRALAHFPFPNVAREVLSEYYVPGGISPGTPYKPVPSVTLTPERLTIAIVICSNFSFVWLAKEGHQYPVSINWLEKVQLPHLFSVYGAMLAGVDYVTMGAGIPLQIPGVLDAYASGQAAEYRVTVTGCANGTMLMRFDPREYFGQSGPSLKRPSFLPIVSADGLASLMMKKVPGGLQGFVVEGPTAGGHNAPPRGQYDLNDLGEPIYGPRDTPDFSKLLALGVPFWIGGSYASPAGLAAALSLGAQGIQVGSIFALSQGSGLDPRHRREIIRHWWHEQLVVRTDAQASPTGYPFKVVQLPGTVAKKTVYQARPRRCDLHCLATPHQLAAGEIVYRCPAEPVQIYQRKEGRVEDTIDARCLCNGLLATAMLGTPHEPPIVTLGDDVSFLRHLTTGENDAYSVAQAMEYLLGPVR